MLLAHAIRNNVVALAQAQNTYKENVIGVNGLMTSVLSSKLPSLSTYPPDWQDFTNAYVQATSDALFWTNNVMARLLDVPDEVKSYNPIISQLLQDAAQQANTLLTDPGNTQVLDMLKNDLAGVSSQLNLVGTFISGALQNIQKFKDKLPDMATQLQVIANKSTADANADQKQIDELNAQIAQLNADIKSLTAAIVGLAIADAAALTLGTLATVIAWPVGAVTWLFLAPAIAVATTYIALDAIKIKNDQSAISALQGQITGITADVAVLHTLATNYAEMAHQTEVIEGNMQAILAAWQTLEDDINAAITDIHTASADAGSTNFQAVVTDVHDAIAEWNSAYTQAGNLALDLKVNDAQLQVGMSADEVQAATAKGRTINIIEYYNRKAA